MSGDEFSWGPAMPHQRNNGEVPAPLDVAEGRFESLDFPVRSL